MLKQGLLGGLEWSFAGPSDRLVSSRTQCPCCSRVGFYSEKTSVSSVPLHFSLWFADIYLRVEFFSRWDTELFLTFVLIFREGAKDWFPAFDSERRWPVIETLVNTYSLSAVSWLIPTMVNWTFYKSTYKYSVNYGESVYSTDNCECDLTHKDSG